MPIRPDDIWLAAMATIPNGYAGIPPCLPKPVRPQYVWYPGLIRPNKCLVCDGNHGNLPCPKMTPTSLSEEVGHD